MSLAALKAAASRLHYSCSEPPEPTQQPPAPGKPFRPPNTQLRALRDSLLWRRKSGNPRVPSCRTGCSQQGWHSQPSSEIRLLCKPTWQVPTELWVMAEICPTPSQPFSEKILSLASGKKAFAEALSSSLLPVSQKERSVCITSLCMYLHRDKCTKCTHALCRSYKISAMLYAEAAVSAMDVSQDMLFTHTRR